MLLVLSLTPSLIPVKAESSFGYTPVETVKTHDGSINSSLYFDGVNYHFVTSYGNYTWLQPGNILQYTNLEGSIVVDKSVFVLQYDNYGNWLPLLDFTEKDDIPIVYQFNDTYYDFRYNVYDKKVVIASVRIEFIVNGLNKPKISVSMNKTQDWTIEFGNPNFRWIWDIIPYVDEYGEGWKYWKNSTSNSLLDITTIEGTIELGNFSSTRFTDNSSFSLDAVLDVSDYGATIFEGGDETYWNSKGFVSVFPVNVTDIDPISYTEKIASFSIDADNTWTDYDMFTNQGVPKGTIAEIVCANTNEGMARGLGVRTDGSGIARWLPIHEAEGGGVTTITMFVKCDSSTGLIECYASESDDIEFYLLGYFEGCDFTEVIDDLGTTVLDATWEEKDMSGESVPANAVCQIAMCNIFADDEREVGIRATDSARSRIIDLDESEAVIRSVLSMVVKADVASKIDWYAEDNEHIDFYLLGWFGSNIDFTEGWMEYSPAGDDVWESKTITEADANSIVVFALVNEDSGKQEHNGLRKEGSSLNRYIVEHESEGGGNSGFEACVTLDADKKCEVYCGDGSEANFYYTGYFSEIAGGDNYYAYPVQTMMFTGSTYRLCTLNRLGEQGITVSISSERTWGLTRAFNQGLTLTCSALGDITKIFSRFVNMAFTVSFNSYREWVLSRSLSQTLFLTGNTERTVSLTKIAEQLLTLSTNSYRVWTLTRSLNQGLTTISGSFKTLDAERILSQSMTLVSNTYRTIDLTKIVEQTITLSLESLRNWSLIRTANQALSLTFNALANLTQVVLRMVSLALNFSANTEREISAIRILSQSMTTTINSYRTWTLTRIGTQQITAVFTTERILSAIRGVSQSISLNTNVKRLATYTREATQTLSTLFDTLITYVEYDPPAGKNFKRYVTIALNLGLETLRTWNLTRIADQTLNFGSEVVAILGEVKLRVVNLLITFATAENVWFTTINRLNIELAVLFLGTIFWTVLFIRTDFESITNGIFSWLFSWGTAYYWLASNSTLPAIAWLFVLWGIISLYLSIMSFMEYRKYLATR